MLRIANQKGFSVVEVLLILVILGILGFTGYFVWHAQRSTDKTLNQTNNSSTSTSKPAKTKTSGTPQAVTDFASCKKAADSILQESYPEVCVTKSGQRFANPDQTATQP